MCSPFFELYRQYADPSELLQSPSICESAQFLSQMPARAVRTAINTQLFIALLPCHLGMTLRFGWRFVAPLALAIRPSFIWNRHFFLEPN